MSVRLWDLVPALSTLKSIQDLKGRPWGVICGWKCGSRKRVSQNHCRTLLVGDINFVALEAHHHLPKTPGGCSQWFLEDCFQGLVVSLDGDFNLGQFFSVGTHLAGCECDWLQFPLFVCCRIAPPWDASTCSVVGFLASK